MLFFSIILLLFVSTSVYSLPVTDSTNAIRVETFSDTAVQIDSVAKSTDSIYKNKPATISVGKELLPLTKDLPDTTFLDGIYAGIGIGWSLGGFNPEQLWTRTLPATLIDLHLNDTTLVVKPDTTQSDLLLRIGDTSQLRFAIKDKPNTYNMTFPISLLLTKYRKDDRFSTALAFSFYSKNQKSSVSMLNDSLSRRIDLRQKFLLYHLSLHFMYAKRIAPIYFSIDGIDRTDFLLGISITPLMKIKTSGSTKRFSDDYRTIGIEDTIKKRLLNSESNGFSMSIRTGISTTQRFSSGALEIDLLYSLSWNDYFYHNGTRVNRGTLNKNDLEADKTLSFLSNRIEISFSLLRKSSRNKNNETAQP